MYYESMPLYPSLPGDRDADACVRFPVFPGERCGPGRMPDDCQYRRVTVENPRCPGERVEVLLGVDGCGNLVVCVRRDPERECCCRPRPPRPCLPPPNPCRQGRLYGSWK